MSMVKLLSAKDARGYGHTLDSLITKINQRVENGSIRRYLFELGPKACKRVRYGWFRSKLVLTDDVYREFHDVLIANGYTVSITHYKSADQTWLEVKW